jgi:hypothetical protein
VDERVSEVAQLPEIKEALLRKVSKERIGI